MELVEIFMRTSGIVANGIVGTIGVIVGVAVIKGIGDLIYKGTSEMISRDIGADIVTVRKVGSN